MDHPTISDLRRGEPRIGVAGPAAEAVVGDLKLGFPELPTNHALALLSGDSLHQIDDNLRPFLTSIDGNLTFPSNKALIERAAKLSVFSAGEHRWTA